jgi:hypothetical protein
MSVRLRPPRGLDLRLPRRNNQSHTVRFRACSETEAHGTPVKSGDIMTGQLALTGTAATPRADATRSGSASGTSTACCYADRPATG